MSAFQTPKWVHRHLENPILNASCIPYPATLVFNPAVIKYEDRYVMIFRNDYGNEQNKTLQGTNLGLAFSQDGVHFEVNDHPCLSWEDQEVTRLYDPRLTVLEGTPYLCFVIETRHGLCGGIAVVTDNFNNFQIKHITTPDNRNIVLFPEKIDGYYARLERPFPMYSRGGELFDIWISFSPDMIYWGRSKLVLATEQVPYANAKIGPGAPPIKTDEGWLVIFHAVDIDPNRRGTGWFGDWKKQYLAGAALLDLKDPSKVIAIARKPLLVPQTEYELDGYRGNTIFPTAAILEDNGEVKIYYGAGDTVIALATAKLNDIIDFVKNNGT